MARWASLIDARRAERAVILVDAGNFCNPRASTHAVAIGPNEIRYGRARLLERADDTRLTLLAANIFDRRGNGTLGAPWTIVHAGGRRTLFGREGGVRVGIFAVVLPHLIYSIDPIVNDYYDVIDPRMAALEAVSSLRARGCDLIVAISHQGWSRSVELAGEVPGIDIVINGWRSHPTAHGETHHGAFVVDTGPNRTTLTEISVVWRGSEPEARAIERGGELQSLSEQPDLKELNDRYEREARARGIKFK